MAPSRWRFWSGVEPQHLNVKPVAVENKQKHRASRNFRTSDPKITQFVFAFLLETRTPEDDNDYDKKEINKVRKRTRKVLVLV